MQQDYNATKRLEAFILKYLRESSQGIKYLRV